MVLVPGHVRGKAASCCAEGVPAPKARQNNSGLGQNRAVRISNKTQTLLE